MPQLLEVRDLVVDYLTPRRSVRAVDHVSFAIEPGEIVGLAGVSGCGKSTTAHAILRILRPPATLTGGRILFMGEDLVPMDQDDLRRFRWQHVSIVFQSAMNSLNPVLRVGDQFIDMIKAHEAVDRKTAKRRASDLLALVGIDRSRVDAYPHELSGGMRQRVVIAMALALHPEIIVMDEPTTALDVVVQREILLEIERLQRELGFAVLFITHDLSLLVEFSRRIAIMYAGEIVEFAPAADLFREPKHPYTVGLMNCFPALSGPKRVVQGIPGAPPDLADPPRGCRFHPRCEFCTPANPSLYYRQTHINPRLRPIGPSHLVACHLYEGENERPTAG
jgi:peptide/nickel transport system ATP-binding protein